jgi:hypothetical protein
MLHLRSFPQDPNPASDPLDYLAMLFAVCMCSLQVSQLAQWSQERADAAAAAAASVAAERAAQQLLAGLKAADAKAQEKLQDLCRCIDDASAQVKRNGAPAIACAEVCPCLQLQQTQVQEAEVQRARVAAGCILLFLSPTQTDFQTQHPD